LQRPKKIPAEKYEQVKSLVAETKELGMEPEEVLVPFLKQQGIPQSAPDMVKWTETQADMVIEFLIDWGEANAIENPDEEVVMKKGW